MHGGVLEQVADIGRQHRPDVTPQPSVQRGDDTSLEPYAFLIQAARNIAERGVEFPADRGPEQRVLVREVQVEALPGLLRAAMVRTRPGLPERERVSLRARLAERDLDGPLADCVVLSHELVHAAVPEQAVPVLVDVHAV